MFNKDKCSFEMQSSINAFSSELKNIRTGRVSPDILKTIVVDSYGSKTPLTQLSNVNNLDNMTLNVNIWDSSLVKIIEKTILDSNLGVNPQTDGTNILLKFPELTAERRKELVKIISEISEKYSTDRASGTFKSPSNPLNLSYTILSNPFITDRAIIIAKHPTPIPIIEKILVSNPNLFEEK